MKPRQFTPIFSRHNMLKLAALACLGCFTGIPAAYAEPLPVEAPAPEAGSDAGATGESVIMRPVPVYTKNGDLKCKK